MTQAQR